MNIHRNTRTTSLVLSNNKALLDEARLQRCKQALPDDSRLDIVPYQSYYKLPEGNKTPIDSGSSKLTQNSDSSNEHARRLRRLTFISGNRLNDRYASRTPQRRNNILSNEDIYTSIETRRKVNHDVSMILQELKQIKKYIEAEMDIKRKTNNGVVLLSRSEHRRISSFMNACDVVLESFEKELEYQKSDVQEVSRIELRRDNSARTVVRFDLSRNEVFHI